MHPPGVVEKLQLRLPVRTQTTAAPLRADLTRAGADVSALLRQAAAEHGPLPAEMPAAALRWRLAGTLAPPSLNRPDNKLRPPLTAELHRHLGTRIAEAAITGPAWPALVAAVAVSYSPLADLLAVAAEHLLDIGPTEPIQPDEYARLLTYRVEPLTHDAATIDPDIPNLAEHAKTPPPANNSNSTAKTSPPDEDLHEPPPDPYNYPYRFAEDDLAGLDVAAQSAQQLATPSSAAVDPP